MVESKNLIIIMYLIIVVMLFSILMGGIEILKKRVEHRESIISNALNI